MAGRTTYLVAYDISDPKRLRSVQQLVSGFGDRLQLSVYRCALTRSDKVLLLAELSDRIHSREDRVLLVALGPTGGRQVSMDTLGLPPPDESTGGIIL